MFIQDNIIFKEKLENFFSKKQQLEKSRVFSIFVQAMISFVDNYSIPQHIYNFNDVRFRVEPEPGKSFTVHPTGLDTTGKIINLTHKGLSYFAILDYPLNLEYIGSNFLKLNDPTEYHEVIEEVFQFFDCFPYAAVHNLDDIYNLLYAYKSNKLKSKLLVLKTDNYFYNQSLESLKKWFNLEYFYVEIGKKYLFRNFKCTRQYHWIQPQAHEFIKKNYIEKIIEEHSGAKTYDNVSILKISSGDNASEFDTFMMTDQFKSFANHHNIFDLNTIKDDLEYKIYLVNKAKNILTGYNSPFNINVYKHCLRMDDKQINIVRGLNTQGSEIEPQFTKLNNGLSVFYGDLINVKIFDKIKDINEITTLNLF